MQMCRMTRRTLKHDQENGISGMKHKKIIYEELVRSELEAMEKTLVTRSSVKIHSSESQCENIKEIQEMPSVRLCRNLPRVTMF